MSQRLEKPVYQLSMPLEGIEEALDQDERSRSEAALANLSALRVQEAIMEEKASLSPNGETKVELKKTGERDVEPRWMELYRRLREAGWNWRTAVYIAWRAQPKKYRWPETQDDLARTCLGLNSDRAIATWRKKNPSIDETVSMLQGSIIFDALPDAMQAMVDVAVQGNYKGHNDRKLMFEMTGVYVPSSKITNEMVKRLGKNLDLSDLSDEELAELDNSTSNEKSRRSDPDPVEDDDATE